MTQRNVRELIHVAGAYASRVAMRGEDWRHALGAVLAERYPGNPVVTRGRGDAKGSGSKPASGWSQYERHRETIIAAHRPSGMNPSATERDLRDRGIPASRRWLQEYLRRWGER